MRAEPMHNILGRGSSSAPCILVLCYQVHQVWCCVSRWFCSLNYVLYLMFIGPCIILLFE